MRDQMRQDNGKGTEKISWTHGQADGWMEDGWTDGRSGGWMDRRWVDR